MSKEILSPATVWNPGEQLFSQCVVVTAPQQLFYLAGQTSMDAAGSVVGIGDVQTQIRLSFENIRLILEDGGATLADIVKLTVYFVDLSALDIYNEVLGSLFATSRPAQTVVQVVRLALPELLIEIDATAVR